MAVFARGADPEVLEAVAGRLKGYSASLEEVRNTATTSIGLLKGNWVGGDLQALMGQWPQAEQQLTLCRESLDSMSGVLARNAGTQRQTSSGGAGTSGAPGGPGGGGKGNDTPDTPDPPLAQKILKEIFTAIKAPTFLKNPLLIANFIKNLGSWDSTLGVVKNLGAIWKSGGALGDLGRALDPAKLADLGKVLPFVEDGGKLARSLGAAGKFLGPVGAAFAGFSTFEDIHNGNYGRAAYDGVMTAVSIAACFPPLTAVAAPIAAIMGIGELVYDHWGAITDFVGDVGHGISQVASTIGGGIKDAASSVWHGLFG